MWGLPGTAGLSLEVRQVRLGGPSCNGEGSLKSPALLIWHQTHQALYPRDLY